MRLTPLRRIAVKPEQLIARAHSLLQPPSRVELGDFGGPCVAALDARNELLADVELGGNILLHPTVLDRREHRAIAGVQVVHALALAGDDAERLIGLDGLDIQVGANGEQESLNVGGRRYGVAVEALMAALSAPPVFFDAPVTEPSMHGVQRRSMRVCEPQSNAALILVDFDAALAIKEASEIPDKSVVREVVHPLNVSHGSHANNVSMAVPVVRWIGERIAAVDQLSERVAA